MSERHFRSANSFFKFSPIVLRLRLLPRWVLISLAANGLLSIVLLLLSFRQTIPAASSASAQTDVPQPSPASTVTASESSRHQLTYEQWVDQLAKEAQVAAEQKPERLTILAGDSISLWFPQNLLPVDRVWLNQGISGETSGGLMKRLSLFDQTQPETIFVMVGINDLLRGTDDQTLLDNQQEIVQTLIDRHPQAQIVIQSILPRAQEPKWEGRDRLLAISNDRIQNLNEQLEAIAQQEGVYFLDLYPLFSNPQGDLRPELTTDGLHLNSQGYQTWSIALQVYSREVLEPEVATGEEEGQ